MELILLALTTPVTILVKDSSETPPIYLARLLEADFDLRIQGAPIPLVRARGADFACQVSI